jgi:hypothetical protein
MNEHSISESRFRPNDKQVVLAATIFYAGNAGFPSYFGDFRAIPREFTTYPEARCSVRQGASGRCGADLAPCVAIV